MKAAVLHPDLGIGGAERLIVDATCALIEGGYETEVFTSYYDENRCFDETKKFDVVVLGKWIPRSIMGKFHALLAYIKMIYIATYLIIYRRHLNLILCDQVSACIPILKFALSHCKIVFYCHFPDQLLTSRGTLLKNIYRKPLDKFEEWSTSLSDLILVNSIFTSRIVRKTFKSLKNRELEVLYPCVRINQTKKTPDNKDFLHVASRLKGSHVFLSLNRFERKKNIGLAIEALNETIAKNNSNKAHLIVAGGYDARLTECSEYYAELELLVENLNLNSRVTFVKSPDDCEKEYLIQISDAVIYTPVNEHFGIVPLEAMMAEKPVIASASGGPLETVDAGVTGILCDANKDAFSDAMIRLMLEPQIGIDMGKAGFERVVKHFSYQAFSDKLLRICNNI